MSLLNIFKKKSKKEPSFVKTTEGKGEKPKKEEKPIETVEKKKEAEEEKAPEDRTRKVKAKRVSEAYRALIAPHITEKATDLTEKNQYVFKVWPRADKPQIKKAIEDLYGVDVMSVKIIKIPRRRRKIGRISGWRKGYKKAIIKIKEGQKIEVLPR